MNPNDTSGFIVISQSGGIPYTTGSSPSANTYSDASISINAYGYGVRYGGGNPPWSQQWSPRVFNGSVWYELAGEDLHTTLNGPTGVQMLDSDDTGATGDGVVLADVTISSFTEPWTVTDMEFTASGTANSATMFSELALYEDSNGNDTFDGSSVDLLATAAPAVAFDPGTGTYTATFVNQAWPVTHAGDSSLSAYSTARPLPAKPSK